MRRHRILVVAGSYDEYRDYCKNNGLLAGTDATYAGSLGAFVGFSGQVVKTGRYAEKWAHHITELNEAIRGVELSNQ